MSGNTVRILLVEDSPADARLVKEMLADAAGEGLVSFQCHITNAPRLGAALEHLKGVPFDVVLADLELPDSSGLKTFTAIHSTAPGVPVVVLTGLADEATGVRAVQEGAQDYLVKGEVDGGVLAHSIRYAIERQRSVRASAGADSTPGSAAAAGAPERQFLEMIGAGARFTEILGLISTVAKTSRTSVLIHGETGTGKELVANSVHYSSSRRDGPFIKINCSAIPDALLEAEMFGYEKGAFTDAKQSKKGLFELADGGTIFLDEIGDMDTRLQPKLLQILENRTFRRVGGVKDIHVDVRVIAATNKDLEAMVREKRFREDLYYRLKVMVINLPPLRERREDILPLADYFLKESDKSLGNGVKRLCAECREMLLRYRWPGNIRELKHALERAVLLSSADEINPEHLPHELYQERAENAPGFDFPAQDMTLEELEGHYVSHILTKSGGNKTRAARKLGISRYTLREKLKKRNVDNA